MHDLKIYVKCVSQSIDEFLLCKKRPNPFAYAASKSPIIHPIPSPSIYLNLTDCSVKFLITLKRSVKRC